MITDVQNHKAYIYMGKYLQSNISLSCFLIFFTKKEEENDKNEKKTEKLFRLKVKIKSFVLLYFFVRRLVLRFYDEKAFNRII